MIMMHGFFERPENRPARRAYMKHDLHSYTIMGKGVNWNSISGPQLPSDMMKEWVDWPPYMYHDGEVGQLMGEHR